MLLNQNYAIRNAIYDVSVCESGLERVLSATNFIYDIPFSVYCSMMKMNGAVGDFKAR